MWALQPIKINWNCLNDGKCFYISIPCILAHERNTYARLGIRYGSVRPKCTTLYPYACSRCLCVLFILVSFVQRRNRQWRWMRDSLRAGALECVCVCVCMVEHIWFLINFILIEAGCGCAHWTYVKLISIATWRIASPSLIVIATQWNWATVSYKQGNRCKAITRKVMNQI